MVPNTEGFLYPVVDEKLCIGCHLCQRTCPIHTPKEIHPQVESAFAAHTEDDHILNESSSGGVFSLLGQAVLDQGGLVFGAAFDGPRRVRHVSACNEEEFSLLRGSKYVQSETGDSYQEVKRALLLNRLVLFSGTPCQIAGLQAFLGKDYENLFCIDTICHSVPSPKAWNTFLDEVEQTAGSPVTLANFREKKTGWERYSLYLRFENGSEQRYTGPDNFYVQSFVRGLDTRPSCYSCPAVGKNHASDITLGDFWGIQSVAPACYCQQGTSLVILHTEKGRQLLEQCRSRMVLTEVDFSAAIAQNPAYSVSAKPHPDREQVMAQLDTVPFHELVRPYLGPTKEDQRRTRLDHSFPLRTLRWIKRKIIS